MKVLIAILAFAVAACTTTPTTPAQSVYAATGTYVAALDLAVKYKQLPSCGSPTATPLCSDGAVVAKVQKADDVAYAALSQAQVAVRTTGFGTDRVSTAITAANAAIAAFSSITATLGVR